MKIVTVDISTTSPPHKYVARYIVLRDRSCREVMKVARENQGVWVFVFATRTVAECPDYLYLRRMAKRDARYQLVVAPVYVGNFKPIEYAIMQVVDRTLRCDREEVAPR
jgi:hypothetical protein